MSRNQIRFLLGITVLTLVILLSYLSAQVGTESEAIRRLSKTISKESIGQEPVQRMTEFRRIKMQDGRKVWEIVARKARYFSGTNTITGQSSSATLTPASSSGTTNGVATTSGYANPEVQPDSGDIIYIEQRSPITRAADQTENIKLIIEF